MKSRKQNVRVDVICIKCGKPRKISIKHVELARNRRCSICFLRERSKNLPQDKAFAWKGGRIMRYGYVLLHINNEHPFWCMARQHYEKFGFSSGYIYEHRLVMAAHLDRPLAESEIVHHLNGIKDDNRIENLILSTRDKHKMGFGEAYQDGYGAGYERGYADALVTRGANICLK